MSELTTMDVTVKFVNPKPKFPKFSSGSIKLTDDSWASVSKDVPITDFVVGNTYKVLMEVTSEGYKNVKKVVDDVKPSVVVPAVTMTSSNSQSYDSSKNLRIARQGTIQALIQGYAMTTPADKLFDLIIPMANRAIEFIETGK